MRPSGCRTQDHCGKSVVVLHYSIEQPENEIKLVLQLQEHQQV